MKVLLIIMFFANADLIGYNRRVNQNYQHIKTVLHSAVSESSQPNYQSQLIKFMIQQGNTDLAAALFKQLNANNVKANNSNGKQKRLRHKRRN